MKNLNTYARICLAELNDIGIYPNTVSEWKVNTRAKSRWGQCSRTQELYFVTYSIQIASCLLEDSAPEIGLKETIIHELLHAVDGCMNHGDKWKALAEKVNHAYGYNVKRTNSYEDKGFEENPLKRTASYKYLITCSSCNSTWKYQKNSKIVQACRNNRATCSCGARAFKVIELK